MTRTISRIALAALLLPLAGTAIAQIASPAQPMQAEGEARMGGSMTLAQFQARQAERTMAADTDGDGRISMAEWTAAMSARRAGGAGGGGYDPAKMFARMDTNHDGFLDKAEIDAASAERFRRMDTNGDGILTADERMAMRGGGRRRGGRDAGVAGQAMPPMAPSTNPQP